MPDWKLRPATRDDLAAAFTIYAEYEFGAAAEGIVPAVPAYLTHLLTAGRVLVAERAGEIVGFAGLSMRGGVAFLSDLFVRPAAQSGAIGGALLRAILPDEGVRCTCSTGDPRALALYIRTGMQPVWPQYLLHLTAEREMPASLISTGSGIAVVEADMADPQLAIWEETIGGRPRREDLVFWAREQAGRALWLLCDGAPIGYAIARLRGGTVTHPAAITLGPLGVRDSARATDGLLAVIAWARAQGNELCLTLPGPHSALAPLLARGFRIADSYTFAASDRGAFADPQRYVSSGPDLF